MIDAKPLLVARDMPLMQVIDLLINSQSTLETYVVMVEAEMPVGIFSTREIISFVAAGNRLDQACVADIPSQPTTVVAETDLGDPLSTLSRLYQQPAHHLIIVDAQQSPLGIVTPTTVQQALQPANLLKLHRVADKMTTQIPYALGTASALQISQLMAEHQMNWVVIVDNLAPQELTPIGIVTIPSLLRSLARRLDLQHLPARSLMRIPLFCLSPSDSLWLAYEQMQQQEETALVVTDPAGKLLGLLTQAAVLQALAPAAIYKAARSLRQSLKQLEVEKVDILQNRNSELERLVRARTEKLEEQAKCDRLLASTTLRIHQSLNLQEILFTTVSEVQQLLQTDRTIIYQLEPTGGGAVVVEAVKPGLTPMQGEWIQDAVFEQDWVEAYRSGRIQALDDVYQAGLSECHIEMLARFQVRASLIVPILSGNHLWGLLVAHHCSQPRRWHNWEVSLLEQLVQQVGIAIQQANLHQQVQTELAERRRVEAELAQIFTLCPDMICVVNLEGYFKRLNPAFTQHLGYTPTDLVDQSFLSFVYPDDRAGTQAELARLAAGELTGYFENRYRCQDGSYKWLAWTAAPDDSGKGLFYAIARDITEQKAATIRQEEMNEELERQVEARTASWRQVTDQLLIEIGERNRVELALQQAKDQLQAVLDAVPGLVSWVSADLRYLGVNRHIAASFNLPAENFIGQPLGFLNHNTVFEQFVQGFFASSATTTSQEVTFGLEGTPRSYLMAAQKYDQDQAAVLIGIDISDRKQIEASLQESEVKFRNLVEQTNDWVWEVDQCLTFTYVNPRVEEITGYSPNEILSRRIVELMPADEAIRFTTVVGHFIACQEAFSQLETTILRKTGQPIVLEISGVPMLDASGNLQGYRGITRDISDRKQVELNIRKALTKEKELNELKTRFITMASHEFRTPLTTILVSAESLERYHSRWTEDKIANCLRRMQVAVKHMNGLLNDVLIVGKAEAGKLEFQPTLLNLVEFCTDLVEEVQIGNHQSNQIQFASNGDRDDVYIDEKLLRHIIVNLLGNAIKYSPANTPITFELMLQEQQIVLQIRDQGIGIPAADQKKLFESFHRASNVGNISGTGLGLAIVKRAVEAHQGSITIASEVGMGTTVSVLLPRLKTGQHSDSQAMFVDREFADEA